MIVRSIVSTGFIFLLTLIFHQPISSLAIQESLPFLLINGVLLLGFSKLLWIDGIHWISVTKATSLSSMEPLLTLLFAWLLLSQVPTVWQLLSIVPICAGVLLLSKNTTKPQVIPAEN